MLHTKLELVLQGDVMVTAEEWVELANGCLCCSVKSDFVAALEGLMLKRDKFDYILIETTGQWAACHVLSSAAHSVVDIKSVFTCLACMAAAFVLCCI